MKTRLHLLLPVLLLLGSCHVGRFFIWNFADIRDYKKFPHAPVTMAPGPFRFIEAPAGNGLKLPTQITSRKKKYTFEQAMEQSGTVAFLVIRNDSMLYERYFNHYGQESIVTSFSAAKSFVSALTGIAVGEGKIKSVQEPITNYLPELDKQKFGAITIEHLLDMQSGIHSNESYLNPFADVAKYYYGRNIGKYIKHLRIKESPGQRFEYISLNTQLLGIITERATGRPLNEYLQEKIWQPLGMEYDATWSIDSRKRKEIKAFCCLNARARDFARFGRLYLNNGQWEGRQIVPQAWVAASTTFTRPKNNFMYSYQWWHTIRFLNTKDTSPAAGVYEIRHVKDEAGRNIDIRAVPEGDYFADGYLGQYIYVYPSKKLIIVRLGKKNGFLNWPYFLQAIARNN